MRLDPKTIEWIIEHITDTPWDEHEQGPAQQSMTFRKGGEEHTYTYFFANDIREWLAGQLHQTYGRFLPEAAERDLSKGPESLTHRVAECSCGWSESFEINHKDKTWIEDGAELANTAHAHVKAEIEKIMERFKWE